MSLLSKYRQVISRMPRPPMAPQCVRLSNGLRVAVVPTPISEIGCVGLYVDYGSRWENEATSGTAHFLEHMLFKGSKRYSKNEVTGFFEHYGAHFNAYTTRETMSYFVHTLPQHADTAIDVLTDSVFRPVFSSALHRLERFNIEAEILDVAANVKESIQEHAHATAFPGGMGLPILGPTDNVRHRIGVRDIASCHATNFTAPRTVFAVTANLTGGSLEQAVAWAERHLGDIPSHQTVRGGDGARVVDGDTPPADSDDASNAVGWIGGESLHPIPTLPRTHVILACRGYGVRSPQKTAVHAVLKELIGAHDPAVDGGFATTPFCQRMLSAVAPAAGGVDCDMLIEPLHSPYGDVAVTGIYASVPPRRTGSRLSERPVMGLVEAFYEELQRLAAGLTAEDLATAKLRALQHMLHLLDMPSHILDHVGRTSVYLEQCPTLEDDLAQLDAVTVDDIRQLILECFCGGGVRRPVLAAMGDVHEEGLGVDAVEEVAESLRQKLA
eukprot:TRINITY_DN9502_c0_g1_i1.p1 TRINITY_DN9502_c0_g1~~TRINITY_DN9502_c0_g1_i1.p1  ORF type:complete len:498 (+),score=115.59 TRINITY_DN9502_c0_g1_i1:158-1651(+)